MGGTVRSIYGLVAASVAATAPAGGQSVQYRSAAGVEYRAQRDTGAIARAESALAADPRNVDRIIQLGVAQSGVRQYREAIQTFTRGLTIAPNDAMLYRWRGHRYLSVREVDRVRAARAAVSRADRPRRRDHGRRYRQCRAGDAELRRGQLVPGAGRHGARACLVRARGALRRLARVWIYHVRSRAAAVAVNERSPRGGPPRARLGPGP